MFTDGETTTGPDPSPIAAAARAMGITIYCIGLIGNTGIDVDALNDWATDPDVTHVAVAPTSADLEQLFADLAANISVPGATNIVINEALNPDFVIIMSTEQIPIFAAAIKSAKSAQTGAKGYAGFYADSTLQSTWQA